MSDAPAPETESTKPLLTDEHLSQAIGGIFNALLAADAEEAQALAQAMESDPNVMSAMQDVKRGRPDHFHLHWEYPHNKLTMGLLAMAGIPARSPAADLYANYSFYESHFKNIYSSKEGGACCADKSRWAMRSLLTYFIDGRPIPELEGERSYWRPERVLNTHESILAFFDALRQLYHGRPKAYLEALIAMNGVRQA